MAKLVAVAPQVSRRGLAGSVLREQRDPLARANSGMRIVLDTHAWIWWVTESRSPRKARAAITRGQDANTLWLSLISIRACQEN